MESLQPFLQEDAKADTTPMTHYVEDQEGIEKMFGDVSYSKGNIGRYNVQRSSEVTSQN